MGQDVGASHRHRSGAAAGGERDMGAAQSREASEGQATTGRADRNEPATAGKGAARLGNPAAERGSGEARGQEQREQRHGGRQRTHHTQAKQSRRSLRPEASSGRAGLNLRKVNASGEDNKTSEAGEKQATLDGARTWAFSCCGHPMQAAESSATGQHHQGHGDGGRAHRRDVRPARGVSRPCLTRG